MKLWPLALYRVSGESMLPAYRPGDVVIGWRLFKPAPGQVVIARTPKRTVIKRVGRVSSGQVWLAGDNRSASTDSRTAGPFTINEIEAVVIAKLPYG